MAEERQTKRYVMIGDLHGNLRETIALWHRVQKRLGEVELAEAIVIFLGDYCDRGPDTCGVIDWLCTLRDSRRSGSTRFVAGNHDFAFAAYLQCLPTDLSLDVAYLESTRLPHFTSGFFTPEVHGGMHYQGRRWGGSCVYNAPETFASYGVQFKPTTACRNELLAAVPDTHKIFLQELEWVVDLPVNFSPGRLICVHAGLLADEIVPTETQVAALKKRDPRATVLHQKSDPSRIAAFVGRKDVRDISEKSQFYLVSGHHGFESISECGKRVVIDASGGRPTDLSPIQAFILPDAVIINHADEPEFSESNCDT